VSRAALAVAGTLAGALILAGCPLPQPLPDYPSGSITPPRILSDPLFVGSSAVLFVPAGCATTQPSYDLNVNVQDSNTIESIAARWFVNYDASVPFTRTAQQESAIQPNPDTTKLVRVVPTFTFAPYQYPPVVGSGASMALPNSDPGVLRIVELVVSNGFDARANQAELSLPNRTAQSGFETQVYRWVFLTVPESTAVPCPTP
jgi:hypothetical protein